MSFDLWTQEYCLSCDKQVHIDGAAYCSEACRLTDYEKTSSPNRSQASSPVQVSSSWAPSTPLVKQVNRPKFYLSPAYDFSNAQPYGTTPAPRHFDNFYASKALRPAQPTQARELTPSSSRSSLCSMHSNNSSASDLVSAMAKKELQAYAVSFEQVRMQRRRSY